MTRKLKHCIYVSTLGTLMCGGLLVNAQVTGQPDNRPGTNQPTQSGQGSAGQGDQMGGNTANAQSNMQGRTGDAEQLQLLQRIAQDPSTAGDKFFVLHLAMDNMSEVQLSQAAERQSQNPAVKRIAQMMIKDHTEAQQRVQAVAQKLSLQLPTTLPQEKVIMASVITAKSGEQFDRAYLSHLKAGHAMTVSKTEDMAKVAMNADVKALAEELAPALTQHYKMVADAAQTVGLAGTFR